MAANSSVEDFEYVTQFFGFTPKSFADGVYNAINDYIQECFKEMGKILDEEFAKKDEILSSQIRGGCKELIGKCYGNLDKIIDKMELYMLRNIFIIPPGVILPEDEVHRDIKEVFNPNDSEASSKIDKEILKLKTSIRKEILFKRMLQSEREKLQTVLADLKRLEKWFDDTNNEIVSKNLHEVINSVCTNSLEINEIVQTYQNMMNPPLHSVSNLQ